MGMPVYRSAPRMVAQRRFFDDQGLRNRCLEIVGKEGPSFFKSKKWRQVLRTVALSYKKNQILKERYETVEERDEIIYEELLASKRIIEEKLRGKVVTHLCYPWFEAGDFSIRASKRAGFQANYFGQKAAKPTNRPGDDPFGVVRLNEVFLFRLPGEGRKSVSQTLSLVWELRKFPVQAGLATAYRADEKDKQSPASHPAIVKRRDESQ